MQKNTKSKPSTVIYRYFTVIYRYLPLFALGCRRRLTGVAGLMGVTGVTGLTGLTGLMGVTSLKGLNLTGLKLDVRCFRLLLFPIYSKRTEI